MFSGIVKGKGRVLERADLDGDGQLVIGAEPKLLDELEIGSSIAVNGACLTAVARSADSFTADVSRETLNVTTLGLLEPGADVNLEPSLRLGDPVDGHWVTGHVDGVGHIVSVSPSARSSRLTIEIPRALSRYVARKGSIAVDGVSLTVNAVEDGRFDVNVIPHTHEVTIVGTYVRGAPVNIEVDVVARYLERLGQTASASMSLEILERHGYASNE